METDWAKANTVQLHFNLVCSQAPPLDEQYPVVLKPSRAALRFPCGYPARIVSGDRSLSLECQMVDISISGTKVAVALPEDAPRSLILHDLANGEVYECDVRWKSDEVIGLRFLDILGPARRRKFLAGEKVPMTMTELKLVVPTSAGK